MTPQIRQASFSNAAHTELNNLSANIMTRPTIKSSVIIDLLNDNGIDGNSFFDSLVLNKDYAKVNIQNEEYTWAIWGNHRAVATITAAVTPGTDIGRFRAPFKVPVDINYFNPNDIVFIGGSDIQARVIGYPELQGNHYIYTMELVNSDTNYAIPPAAVAVGKRVALGYNAFPEGSDKGFSRQHFPEILTNQLTILRTSYSITRSAFNNVVEFGFRHKGKDMFFWDYQARWDAFKQHKDAVHVHTWFGEYNKTPDGRVLNRDLNNNVIRIGAGIKQLVSGYNDFVYETITADFLQQALLKMKTAYQHQGALNLVVYGGAGFVNEFNRGLKQEFAGTNIIASDLIAKRHGIGNKIKIGADIMMYEGLLGTTLTVVHVPFFDDPTRFPEMHGGFTRESYNGYILNHGHNNGRPNIEYVCKAGNGVDSMLQWTVNGSIMPEKGMSASGFDGMEGHILEHRGICINNPYSCGRFIKFFG